MLIWGTNGVSLIIILLIIGFNYVIFKSWKRRKRHKYIAPHNFYNQKIYFICLSGMLISIYLLLQLIAVIKFYVGATAVFELSLVFAYIFLVSIILGPFWSCIVILIGNTISYLIYPAGAFLLMFAASQMLGSTISWLVMDLLLKYRKFIISKLFSRKRYRVHQQEGSNKFNQQSRLLQRYQLFLVIVIAQIFIYIFCSVIADSLAIRFIFNAKKSFEAIVMIRIILLIPVVMFESAICYVFLVLIPKSVRDQNVLIFMNGIMRQT